MGNKKVWLVLLFVFIMINLTIPSFTAAKNPHDPASKTVVETITSKALLTDERPKHNKLTYKIYLPRGYDKKRSDGYPVVYLLHGSEGNENSWDDFFGKLDEMIEKKEIEPFIAVVPAAGNSYWVNSKKFGHYESAVIDDLIPHIDKKYNSIADRSGRFISGYSMGGYGALRYSMVYPDLFSGATLLSPAIQNAEPPATSGAVERGSFGEPYDPALWKANNYPTAINSYVKQPYRVPVYIVSGDDDWNHLSEKEDLPPDAYKYNMEVQAVQLYQELHRKNLFSIDFQKWEDVPSSPAELRIIGGGHGLDVWLKGFQEGLKYMFGKAESPEFSPIYDPDSYSSEKKGTVNTYSLHAPSLIQDETPGDDELKYVVYLPEEYNPTAEKKYPVLYLLHGSYGDEKSWDKFWPILDKMIEEKKIEPVMAVAPVTGNSYWVDSLKYGNMESAFINDLIKKIDKDFKTIPDRNGRGLVGYSMGGYGALRYSLVYPHLFGGTSLLSPAIQAFDAPKTSGAVERGSFGDPFDAAIWDSLNYPKALEAYGQQPFKVPIFIMTGDDDWNHISEKEDLPEDAFKYNMEVQAVTSYQFLHRSNVFNRPFEKWEPVPGSPAELRILNGGHGMQVWAAGFEQGLLYMFENGLRAQ
ncbi:alpha/beta hydrolase [Metabacillus hrfriensis]|uniref:Alpha/beta hydrolase-fold protein n=1 Tax=Metabacillus hrfriensis TaxID=3048891 RepID=A0ACD4RDR8_9BACI|nr:alpha/beta hydrolase-fold protein [Metabacillus sp. CT-WN-B3]WHZ58557.1 alpha/beta hydrolase-fold protein [Metabacillus sp. CT-WN-B3]